MKCPCYKGDFGKCPFPDSIKVLKVSGFKDEPSREIKICSYRSWTGADPVYESWFTKKEYDDFRREYTFCTHPRGERNEH